MKKSQKIFPEKLLAAFKIFLLAAPAACFSGAPLLNAAVVRDAHTEVELIAEVEAAAPGHPFHAGIVFSMDPEWHVYWKNPGDSGLAPTIRWELPEGFRAGEILWPAPSKIDLPPLSSYGYEGRVLLSAPLEAPASLPPDKPVTLKAKVEWLACKVDCIPGKADLELMLPVKKNPAINKTAVEIFSRTRFRLPISEAFWQADASRLENKILLQIRPSGSFYPLGSVYFFAENPDLVKHAAAQPFLQKGGNYHLEIPLSVNAPKDLLRLKGVLVSTEGWRGKGSESAWGIDIPFTAAARTPASGMSFLTAVLFAFLGGIILNLMPCVLPVLSLKILGFVREAAEDPRRVFRHGLIFTAGVTASFWLLAALLLILQAAGREIGWGFQLQSPWFVGFLSLVFLFFAFNLFGFFEITSPLGASGSRLLGQSGALGTFANGALATLVATPCTAPFMGAALGFALTQKPLIVWIIFTSLALGMSAPYLLLSANPKWLRFVPKPGAWMVRLKQILGVLLLFTAIWLLWILSIQTGAARKILPGSGISHEAIRWEPYDETRLAELRASNQPVFIDFTAAWCLTCQVNERAALETPKVREAFRKSGAAMLKADWTNQDPGITRALAGYGRSSIPFYVLYPPGQESKPVFLPEILTPSIVLDALKNAGLIRDTN